MTSRREAIDTPNREPGTARTLGCPMTASTTRLYSIEVKDAETGDTVIFTAVDWTAEQKRLAVALIGRLTGLHAAEHRREPGERAPKRDKDRYH